ncbi:hypothetical protein D9M71_834420 [compost metagenome]
MHMLGFEPQPAGRHQQLAGAQRATGLGKLMGQLFGGRCNVVEARQHHQACQAGIQCGGVFRRLRLRRSCVLALHLRLPWQILSDRLFFE